MLATDTPATSRQTHLYRGHWFDALEVYWKDLNRPGPFADRDYGTSDTRRRHGPQSRLAASSPRHVTVAPGETQTVRFALTLVRAELPQVLDDAGLALPPAIGRRSASGRTGTRPNGRAPRPSPSEVLSRWDELRDETFAFRDAVYRSTLPLPVLDAAAANLSILKSPTTLRLEDGTFYGWEGCHPDGRHLRGQLHACLELPAGAALPLSRRSSARCARPTTSTT